MLTQDVGVNSEVCIASSPGGSSTLPHLASTSCLSLNSTCASHRERGELTVKVTTIKISLFYKEGPILPGSPAVVQHITLAVNALSSMLEAARDFCSCTPQAAGRHAWEHIARVELERDKLVSPHTVPGPTSAVWPPFHPTELPGLKWEINHTAPGLATPLCQCCPLLGGAGGAGRGLAVPVAQWAA